MGLGLGLGSLSPTLATGGKCIITSTPNSDEDTFAMIWNQANKMFDEHGNEQEVGVNGFKPMLATWGQHPDRDAAWATEERGRIGEERFKREHECEFVIYDETLIDPLKLLDMSGREPILKAGQTRWYKHPTPEGIYVLALDPSTGTGGDNAAIQVLELPSMVQVAEWCHNKTPIEGQIKVCMEIIGSKVSVLQKELPVVRRNLKSRFVGPQELKLPLWPEQLSNLMQLRKYYG